ncbi:MAG TPA: histidine kinase [Blastocatellia bacterium]|nr:histidine kinase [Blastocatellia bacterium]
MEIAKILERRWLRIVLILGVWTLFGLFLTSQTYMVVSRRDKPPAWHKVFLAEMAFAYAWAALTPLTLWLARRFPLERAAWGRSLAIHVGVSLVAGLGTRILRDLLFIALVWNSYDDFSFTKLLLNVYGFFDYGAMIYWLILLISYALNYYRRYREGEIRASRLEAQLAQAQLEALKMQLQPHFLFNTLHSVSALIHKDPVSADRMIARLGDFLRLTLENAGTQEVSLQEELEFLKCYLEIERVRFRERLTVQMNIEPQTLNARLPNLILQPIVENAIKHGIAPRTKPGRIEIEARRFNGILHVQITDNGPGLPANGGSGRIVKGGVGLANTEARLQQLYGSDHRLDLANTSKGGLTVILEIPFKR